MSDKIKVTLLELETYWSVDDAFEAHAVLDLLEAEESKAMARQESSWKR